ncbi:MAG: amidase [Halomonas sp.]|nr:amidase [Halomonas sp.]
MPCLPLNRRHFMKLGAGIGVLTSLLPLTSAHAATDRPADLTEWSALTLSDAIRKGEVGCREVMIAYLERIERLNPTYNAIVSLQPRETLLVEADKADSELVKGHYRGWMHGFPHAVKNLAATAGILTTKGSPLFSQWVPDHDDIFVERIRAAGAILIGKTNTPELGLGSQTYNPVHGPTRNAWDPSLCAGGSSGGAAVALATRMLPVADGSDMMGSLRNPAAFNNVFGFRPSQGRVPRGPNGEMFYQQLSYQGPMGRDVADAARLLATMAGFDHRVPMSLSTDTSRFAAPLDTQLAGVKVGWLGDFDGYLSLESGILALCEKGLATFEQQGATVEPTQPDFSMPELWQTWLTLRHFLIAGGTSELYANPENRAQMKPELIWEIEGGQNLSALDVYRASSARSRWYQALDQMFEHYDVLALPTAQVFPFDVDIHWPEQIAGKSMDTYHRWMEVVIPGTLAGCPVANVPVGFDERGRPMGIQLIGRMKEDLKVLQIAHSYTRASGLFQQHPDITA